MKSFTENGLILSDDSNIKVDNVSNKKLFYFLNLIKILIKFSKKFN